VETLREMGVNAELGGRNDITVDGRKISGNAQFTNLKSMFSHGTLLLNSHIEDVVQALNVKIDKIESKGIKSVRSRVANISEFLKEELSVEEFREKIVMNLFKDYETMPTYELSDSEWEEVNKLSESKYKTWEWNFGRSPEFNIQKVNRFDFGQVDARIFVKDGKINNIKFFGDFLGYGDSVDVEMKLEGIVYKEEEVLSALKDTDLKYYFGNVELTEFVKFICL
jgi:lipoate-protein ligase A